MVNSLDSIDAQVTLVMRQDIRPIVESRDS